MKRARSPSKSSSPSPSFSSTSASAQGMAKKIKVEQRPTPMEVAQQFPSKMTVDHARQLHHRGFTVIENVFSSEECDATIKTWLNMLESYDIGFKADDPATWKPTKHRPMSTRGMQDYPPVAQESWVWDARLQCAPIFSTMWGVPVEDLITSMDRVCFVPPTQLLSGKEWWHIDQARHNRRGSRECVQGMLVLEDIGEGEVSLELMTGAHKHHGAFFEEWLPRKSSVDGTWVNPENEDRLRKCHNADWLKFLPEDRDWYLAQSGVKRERIHAKRGSLILWDSRLPHHAVPPTNRSERSTLSRHTVYISMVPRSWATERRLEARQKWFETGRATSHWPQDGKPFGAKPRTYGQPLPEYPGFSLEQQLATRDQHPRIEEIRRLVGY